MATEEAKQLVRLALFTGANPQGFSGETREAYLEVLTDIGVADGWWPKIPFANTKGAGNWLDA